MSKFSKGHPCISCSTQAEVRLCFYFSRAPKRKRPVFCEEEGKGSKARLNNPWQSKNPLLEKSISGVGARKS
jgi:hypothetical protein